MALWVYVANARTVIKDATTKDFQMVRQNMYSRKIVMITTNRNRITEAGLLRTRTNCFHCQANRPIGIRMMAACVIRLGWAKCLLDESPQAESGATAIRSI